MMKIIIKFKFYDNANPNLEALTIKTNSILVLSVFTKKKFAAMALRKDFLRKRRKQKSGWRSRTFVSGNFCFKSLRKQKIASFFYSERFEVNADPPAKFTVHMKISAGIECTILCARIMLPNRLITPTIDGVGGYNISVFFSTHWFPYTFYYSLGLVGKNTTEADLLEWKQERIPGFW